MRLPDALSAPLARVGLWLPLATLVAFGAVDRLGLVIFPNAVLGVTFFAAVGWVVVGLSGDRIEGPLSGDPGASDGPTDDGRRSVTPTPGAVSATTGTLTYLTATTALGWAVTLLLYAP